jgi:hypothetical protein
MRLRGSRSARSRLTQSAVADGLLLTQGTGAPLLNEARREDEVVDRAPPRRHVGTSLIHAQEGSTVRLFGAGSQRRRVASRRKGPRSPAQVSGVGLKSSQMLGVGRKTRSDVRLSGVSLTSRGALFGRLGWS